MDTTNNKKTILWTKVALTAAFCLFALLFFNRCSQDWFVENNDNFSIASVTSSLKYDNYVIFLNPVLCGIINKLAHLMPKSDAFAAASLILCELAFVWCAFLVFTHTQGLKKIIYITVIALYASIGIYSQNFTVIAAFLIAAGISPLLAMILCGKTKGAYTAVSVFFIAFGYMYRSECVLLFLPFAVVCITAALLQNKDNKALFKKSLMSNIFAVIAALAVLGGAAHLTNNIPDIKEGIAFNTARASVQDYPLLPYEKAKENLPANVTENDYTLITHFMTPDTMRMDTAFLQTFADTAIDRAPNRAEIIKDTLQKNKYSLKSTILFLCTLAVFLTLIVSRENAAKKAAAFFCFLGIILCGAAFLYIGRLPERVLISVITAGLSALCAILYTADIKSQKAGYIAFAAIFIAAVSRYAAKDMGSKPFAIFTAKTYNADFEEPVAATYTDGCVFIWDTINYSLAPAMYFSANCKLPSEQFEMHNISAGGLSYMQRYQRQAFAEMGIQNPAYDLVYRPGTYYVGELSVMETYIKENIEPDIHSELIGYILNTPVYKFTADK